MVSKDRGVHGIEITGDGGAGELAAYAVAAHPRGSDLVFSSIPFSDPGLIHSPDVVFAGVPIGPQPTLPNGLYVPRVTVANFSAAPVHVTVTLSSTVRNRATSSDGSSSVASPQTITRITIPARQSREVVFKGTESQSGLVNSIYVASDAKAGDLQGSSSLAATAACLKSSYLARMSATQTMVESTRGRRKGTLNRTFCSTTTARPRRSSTSQSRTGKFFGKKSIFLTRRRRWKSASTNSSMTKLWTIRSRFLMPRETTA